MLKMKFLALPLIALLSACASTGPAIKTVDTGCSWTRAIRVSKGDILSDGTAAQIEAHNETGRKRCGWKRRTDK